MLSVYSCWRRKNCPARSTCDQRLHAACRLRNEEIMKIWFWNFMIYLLFSHILYTFFCYIMSIEVLPEFFISDIKVESFGNSYKMGAADRRRVNGCRTSTNNNSVWAAVTCSLNAFIYAFS